MNAIVNSGKDDWCLFFAESFQTAIRSVCFVYYSNTIILYFTHRVIGVLWDSGDYETHSPNLIVSLVIEYVYYQVR